MQYVGIQETFTGPLRPQLLVGDVASVYYGSDAEESTGLGIITEVKHSFGRKGFSTEFTLDSGGSATDASGYIVTSSAALSGDTRRKRVLDFIRNGGNS